MRWLLASISVAVACTRAGADERSDDRSAPLVQAAVPAALAPARTSPPLTLIEITAPVHPLAQLSEAELAHLLDTAPERLGTASLGQPNRGALFNGVRAESNELWEVVDPDRSWATPVTLAGLRRAISAVHQEFPGTPRLHLGDLSTERGGALRPHRSHQSGLDADVSYYYTTGQRWYVKATETTLDRARSWALVRAFVGDPTVEYVFVDASVQELLRAYALESGASPEWLDTLFGGVKTHTEAPIRHTWGHRTHLHVRFVDPTARETAERLYPLLKARRRVR